MARVQPSRIQAGAALFAVTVLLQFIALLSCWNCHVCMCAYKLLGEPHCEAHLCICGWNSVRATAFRGETSLLETSMLYDTQSDVL